MVLSLLATLASIISLTGIYEITKTSKLAHCERTHDFYVPLLRFEGQRYFELMREGSHASLEKAHNLLTAESEEPAQIGLRQLARNIAELPHNAFTMIGISERLAFPQDRMILVKMSHDGGS